MKKPIYIVLSIMLAAGFSACKKEEPTPPNHGSVSLRPAEMELKYDEEQEITPVYSDEGSAKDKLYNWENNNKNVVSFEIVAGGKIKVKATRIGDAVITYRAQDSSIFAECKISVNARTTFLSGIRFNAGDSKNTVKNNVQWTLNERESTDKLLVYDVGMEKIKQEIYYFENDKLFSLLVILNDTEEIETEAIGYLKERFPYIASGLNISYYDAGIEGSSYAKGTIAGVFLPDANLPKEGVSGKLGVRYTTHDNLNK